MKELTVVLTIHKDDTIYIETVVQWVVKNGYDMKLSPTVGLAKARRECIDQAGTEYTLVLDFDTRLPDGYVENAIKLLKRYLEVGAVALDYEVPHTQGHLAFGTSIWRTDLLKKIYDWDEASGKCECLWMWERLQRTKFLLSTLPMQAVHLKGKVSQNSQSPCNR